MHQSNDLTKASNECNGDSGRMVGYARVSTDDQDLSLQIDALIRHGIAKNEIFMDKLSGAKTTSLMNRAW